MYDDYEPVPPLDCPWCSEPAAGWQGNDGANRLLVWRQGERHPVDQPSDPEIEPVDVEELTLPDAFRILGWCANDHTFVADCRCVDGVWTETDLSGAEAQVAERASRDRRKQERE